MRCRQPRRRYDTGGSWPFEGLESTIVEKVSVHGETKRSGQPRRRYDTGGSWPFEGLDGIFVERFQFMARQCGVVNRVEGMIPEVVGLRGVG